MEKYILTHLMLTYFSLYLEITLPQIISINGHVNAKKQIWWYNQCMAWDQGFVNEKNTPLHGAPDY